MSDYPVILLYKLRFLFAGICVIVCLLLVAVLVAGAPTGSAQAAGSMMGSDSGSLLDSSDNVIASGAVMIIDEAGQTVHASALRLRTGAQSVAATTVRGSTRTAHGVQHGVIAVGRGITYSVRSVGHIMGRSVLFVVRIPGSIVGSIARTKLVNNFIRPADHLDTQVPIIDPNSPELLAAIAALPAVPDPAKPVTQDATPVWPIHGQITTQFDTPHWPYQRVHTGMDISDARPAGETPIKPFRPGKVTETIRSREGLGNHVTVDHGNGVTSLYAHLASIAVQVGQDVTLNTVLGQEGSTGVSTGTHLHFEIRVNGQATDPHQFISGQP